MVDWDSAFLWESEALRSSSPRQTRRTHHSHREPRGDGDWVTLREGHEMTGVPVSTLRKWALGGNVATYMEETPVGQLRMISLHGVYQRAEELGRKLSGQPPSGAAAPASKAAPRRHSQSRATAEPDVPPGTTLVPLDAWNKMLLQLGNLHQAGQQLAEASARAARAETEAAFLKERLTELRLELAKAGENERSPEPVQAKSVRDSPGMPSVSKGLLRQIYSSWRGRPRS